MRWFSLETGHLLRLAAAFPVISLHRRHTLESELCPYFAGSFFRLGIGKFDLPFVGEHLAFQADGLDCTQGFQASLRFDIFGD